MFLFQRVRCTARASSQFGHSVYKSLTGTPDVEADQMMKLTKLSTIYSLLKQQSEDSLMQTKRSRITYLKQQLTSAKRIHASQPQRPESVFVPSRILLQDLERNLEEEEAELAACLSDYKKDDISWFRNTPESLKYVKLQKDFQKRLDNYGPRLAEKVLEEMEGTSAYETKFIPMLSKLNELRSEMAPESFVNRTADNRICLLDGTFLCYGKYDETYCAKRNTINPYSTDEEDDFGGWENDHILPISTVAYALVGKQATTTPSKTSKVEKKLRKKEGLLAEAERKGLNICAKEVFRLLYESGGPNPNLKLVCPSCHDKKTRQVFFNREKLLRDHPDC